MKSARKTAAVALCLVCLAGCSRRDKAVLPPVEEAPVLPVSEMAHMPELPSIPPPSTPDVILVTQQAEKQPPPASSGTHHPTHRRSKPAAEEPPGEPQTSPAQTEQAEQARNTQPSDMSPIGQLSTANDNAGTPDRRTIVELIASTESGVKKITRALSPDEKKTVAQIQTYLAKARDALKVDDLTGADTLATKAHLLLDELVKD